MGNAIAVFLIYLTIYIAFYLTIGESQLSKNFFGWFLKFACIFMGALLSGTALHETIMNKPFYMPMEVLGMFGAFFTLLYVYSWLLDSFYPDGYPKDWIIIYAFCTIISAGSVGDVNTQAHNVLAMSLTLSIVQMVRSFIINQFTPDETGDPKILTRYTTYIDKLVSTFLPKTVQHD